MRRWLIFLAIPCALIMYLTMMRFHRLSREGEQKNYSKHLDGPGGWRLDSRSAELVYNGCAIDVVPAASLTEAFFMSHYANRKPVLIRGLADEWPAKKDGAWSKDKLLSRSVNMPVNVGQSSTIVSQGAGETEEKSLQQFINEMSEIISDEDDDLRSHEPKDVSFDVSFFYKNLELLEDFSNPDIFEQFCNKETDMSGESWLIFSLGSSRSGLPFHVHGQTWLGLVFGQKRWFLYPPGSGLSPSMQREMGWHPLMNTITFMDLILSKRSGGDGDSPLQCTQLPGDVMYLPAGYKHATLNIGETLAAGCQGFYFASERLSQCSSVLKQVPNDIECLKAYAIGLLAEPFIVLGKSNRDDGTDNYKKLQSHAMKQISLVVPLFLRAIELRPGDPGPYYTVIELLIKINDIQQARRVTRRAAKQFTRALLPETIPDRVVYDIQLTIVEYMHNLSLDEESQHVLEHNLAVS